MVEQWAENPCVGGSIPLLDTRGANMRDVWDLNILKLMSTTNLNIRKVVNTESHVGYQCYNELTRFFYSFVFCLRVIKMKLKGKTLRFKRLSRYFFFFKFGVTHPSCSLLYAGTYFKRKGKQKFWLFGYNKFVLLFTAKYFIYWKPSNLYHWRGIRLVRTIMRRKAGKVSEYR